MAISAGGVALASVGGLLVWAGLSNATPLTTLHGVFSGSPTTLSDGSIVELTSASQAVQGQSVPGSQGSGAAIVAGARQFAADQYSQARRNDPGYSDCSSFVSKALLAAGITPCNWSGGNYPTTVDYHAWSAMKGIPLSQAQAGDILLSFGHIAIVTSPTSAIGQENPRINVQEGTFSSIMALTGSYGCYRIEV